MRPPISETTLHGSPAVRVLLHNHALLVLLLLLDGHHIHLRERTGAVVIIVGQDDDVPPFHEGGELEGGRVA